MLGEGDGGGDNVDVVDGVDGGDGGGKKVDDDRLQHLLEQDEDMVQVIQQTRRRKRSDNSFVIFF